MKIRYKKLIPEAKTPFKKYDDDAGYDLFAVSKIETEQYIEYGTGIAIEIPKFYVGLVFPRSSVTEKDLILKNCVGIIDSQYRGEIRCRFFDTEKNKDYHEIIEDNIINKIHPPYLKKNIYEIGERIVQIIIIPIPSVEFVESDELSDTQRSAGGFGSSGLK
jgi:dUTP pyrophosphatase